MSERSLSRFVESWTDERLDDLAAALRPLPEQVAKLSEAVDRLTGETRSIRADLSSLQRQVAQIGWALAAALLASLVALIVAVA
jgi:chromosome segregation ATPase